MNLQEEIVECHQIAVQAVVEAKTTLEKCNKRVEELSKALICEHDFEVVISCGELLMDRCKICKYEFWF